MQQALNFTQSSFQMFHVHFHVFPGRWNQSRDCLRGLLPEDDGFVLCGDHSCVSAGARKRIVIWLTWSRQNVFLACKTLLLLGCRQSMPVMSPAEVGGVSLLRRVFFVSESRRFLMPQLLVHSPVLCSDLHMPWPMWTCLLCPMTRFPLSVSRTVVLAILAP